MGKSNKLIAKGGIISIIYLDKMYASSTNCRIFLEQFTFTLQSLPLVKKRERKEIDDLCFRILQFLKTSLNYFVKRNLLICYYYYISSIIPMCCI
jgi:hypothetical protein